MKSYHITSRLELSNQIDCNNLVGPIGLQVILAGRIALQFYQRNGRFKICQICECLQCRYFPVSGRERKQEHGKKTSQDVALFKTFLREGKLNDPEELTPLQLDASLRQFIVSVRKQDGSDYEPSSLRCMVASIERYL